MIQLQMIRDVLIVYSWVPVVAAGATGASSLVDPGETGQLVPPGDAAAYAEAIAPYCTDHDLRRAHGEAGERKARQYDWDAINQVVADVYVRLVEQREELRAQDQAKIKAAIESA